MADRWESRQELLDAAAAAGYAMSGPQLARLHRADLIPSPEVRALGRGLGTESRFPTGTAARLVRVAQIRAQTYRLTDAAWRLWWEDGGHLPRPARDSLAEYAASLDTQKVELMKMLGDDWSQSGEGSSRLDRFYDDAENARLRGPLGRMRRNVGREQLATVLHALAAAGVGQPDFALGHEEASADSLVTTAFGLTIARSQDADRPGRWTVEEPVDLAGLARLAAARSVVELAASSDAELDRARVQMRCLYTLLTSAGAVLDGLFGRGASGLRTAIRMLDVHGSHPQMLLLLSGMVLRTSGELRGRLDQVERVLAPQAAATTELLAFIRVMRTEVPVLADAMSDERFAAAHGDKNAMGALSSEIRRLRAENTAEFDAFFASHPEATSLTAAFEAAGDE